jgi:hypothetical protein
MPTNRFNINWRNGAYYVSIPNYNGGEVVDAKYHDKVVARLGDVIRAAGLHENYVNAIIEEVSKDA